MFNFNPKGCGESWDDHGGGGPTKFQLNVVSSDGGKSQFVQHIRLEDSP